MEDAAEEKSPAIKLDPSKLDLREYRQPGPYIPGEDLDKDQFIRSDRSPIALNRETGKRDFLYQYLEQNQEVMGPKTQMFNRFANPDDGTLTFGMEMAGAPRRIRGKFAPPGAIIKDPHVDSPYYAEPRFFPTAPSPGRGAGPQLPGFV